MLKKPKKAKNRPDQPRLISEEVHPSEVIADYSGPLPSLKGVKRLSFDTETTTEDSLWDRRLTGISYRTDDGRSGYVAVGHPGPGNVDEQKAREWAKGELRAKELIAANAKHEIHTMRKWGADLEEGGNSWRDVFHQAALLDDHRYKLNMDLLCRELGLAKIEAEHTAFWKMPAAQVAPIAVEDAELAWRAFELQQPRIESQGLGEVLDLEDGLVYAVCEMERNGCFLDVPKLVAWKAEVDHEIAVRADSISKAVGFSVDPKSWQDMERLFAAIGVEDYETTPSGQPSLTEEAFLKYEQGHPLLKTALEIRQLCSMDSKYLSPYLAAITPDGLLRYSLHQLKGEKGTITGRFSSSNVNIQQVSVKKKQPPLTQRWPIRELFVPPPGRVWVSSDASQIEYRIFAHYAAEVLGKTRLAEAYARDPKTDFHALVVDWTGLIREFAKNVNFCKLYGGGAEKIAWMCKVPVMKGHAIVSQYDREFPEAKRLMARASEQAEQKGFVRTILGRRRRFNPGDRFYSALNAVFQGSAADIMKRKLREAYDGRRAMDLKMRNTVHDEVNGDLPPLPGACAPLADLLNRQTTPLRVPIIWDTKPGRNWHEAH